MADPTPIAAAIQAIRQRVKRIERKVAEHQQNARSSLLLADALSDVAADLECDADKLERDFIADKVSDAP